MLKEVLSIAGKSGLFKIISNGKNMLVVEELLTGRRFPAHAREKIISLGDVSIYTDKGDIPLSDVLELVREKNASKEVDYKKLDAEGSLRTYFAEILPDFDRDRVYTSDLKKLFSWYNILIQAGYTSFAAPEPEAAAPEAESAPEAAPEAN